MDGDPETVELVFGSRQNSAEESMFLLNNCKHK